MYALHVNVRCMLRLTDTGSSSFSAYYNQPVEVTVLECSELEPNVFARNAILSFGKKEFCKANRWDYKGEVLCIPLFSVLYF